MKNTDRSEKIQIRMFQILFWKICIRQNSKSVEEDLVLIVTNIAHKMALESQGQPGIVDHCTTRFKRWLQIWNPYPWNLQFGTFIYVGCHFGLGTSEVEFY